VQGGASAYLNNGLIHNNEATNGGGVLLSAANSSFAAVGGTISSNQATVYGGAIMRAPIERADGSNVLAPNANSNISIGSGVVFQGNTANGRFAPPVENVDASWHSFRAYLTNYDISFTGTEVLQPLTVSFDANGGLGTMEPVSLSYGLNFEIPANGFYLPGWAFTGWAASGIDDSFSYGDTINNVTSDITLIAQWERIQLNVTWHTNNGSLEPVQTAVYYGDDIIELGELSFANHGFTNWYLDLALTNVADFPIVGVTEDAEFWAGWEYMPAGEPEEESETPEGELYTPDTIPDSVLPDLTLPDASVPEASDVTTSDDGDIPVVTPVFNADPGGTNPEEAPTPMNENATLFAYEDMWIEIDETNTPLGSWVWDDDEMWIFDDYVPLGAFAAFDVASAPAPLALMPQTGLTNNVLLFAGGMVGFLSLALGIAFITIKERNKN
jgi:hypothetical protein